MVERHVVKKNQVLVNLAHVADVRNNGQAEFLCQQADRQKFADSRQPGAIRLYKMDRSGVDEILKQDTVWNMFATGDPDRFDFARQNSVRVYIVGMGRLFDPQRTKPGEFTAHAGCIWKVPLLVGIEHQDARIANRLAQHLSAP